MEENNTFFPKDVYLKHLTAINGINFTPREIDIISCLLNARRTSQIASMLSIAPRTITTHFRNIMLKLDCNSQESIINFIERSNKLSILREYYSRLTVALAFEKALKEVSKLKKTDSSSCLLVYGKEEALKNALLHHLQNHLSQAGINIKIQEQELDKKVENVGNLIHALLVFMEKKDNPDFSQDANNCKLIDLSRYHNYYLAAFDILQGLLPNMDLESIFKKFREYNEGIHRVSRDKYPQAYKGEKLDINENRIIYDTSQNLKNRKNLFILAFLVICLFAVEIIIFKGNKEEGPSYIQIRNTLKEPTIRSDLVIPAETALLHRPELISQINDKFKGQNGIQTVALVGAGGAGKTTLAREYAHQQKANIIWEVNAETHENLERSFENLADALSKTEEDKKMLRGIQEIKNLTKREEKIIQFVKEHLRSQSNWFLIYDNVEKFSDIQKYFPQDSTTWGQGKIILTTQDNNIQNNKKINYILQVGELSPHQKLCLFIKIISHIKAVSISPAQKEELKAFLEKIPSFPLDISIAAYYLITTQTSYKKYLMNIEKNSKEFEDIQKNILKEVGNYTKTRYSIIILSLQNLIKVDKNFKDILLLISLINSQNIPRFLLDKYKSNLIIDKFIYNLRKYSLLIYTEPDGLPKQNFSIHRNVHNIIFFYLKEILKSEKYNNDCKSILEFLEAYISEAIAKEDFSRMKTLVSHYENFLNHIGSLNSVIRASVMGKLGFIYAESGEYAKGKYFLEESLVCLKERYNKNRLIIAKHLTYLGSIDRILGNYDNSLKNFEEGLKIFKKYFPENYDDVTQLLILSANVYKELGFYEKAKILLEQSLIKKQDHLLKNSFTKARILTFLGNIYNTLGEYKKAREALQQSILIYKNNHAKNNRDFARALTHLGHTYRGLGFYEKAKDLFEYSYAMHQELFGNSNIRTSWALAHLGNAYRELGHYGKAEKAITQSLLIHKKHFKESHQRIAWLLLNLGNLYYCIGNYVKAKYFLKLSLNIYEKHYGKDHIDVARNLRIFAKIFDAEGNAKLAESYLQKCLKIAQQKNHSECYLLLEDLSDLCMKRFMVEVSKRNTRGAFFYKKQAIKYLNQAQSIVKKYMLEDSPHVKRIQLNLENIKRQECKIL